MNPYRTTSHIALCVLLAACGRSVDGDPRRDLEAGLSAYQAGDVPKAREAWLRANRAGAPEAAYYLGVLANQGPEGDAEAAARWFEIAARAGHAKARYNLALAYERGLGVVRDRGRAMDLLERAARSADVDAMHMLGLLLIEEGRAKEGVASLERAAGAGHAPSALALGALYAQGTAVPRDPRAADRWYSKALAGGEVSALRPLLEARRELARADATPLPELRTAAAAGDAEAMNRLALRLAAQEGSRGEAVDWLGKAARAGHVHAKYDLAMWRLRQDGDGEGAAAAVPLLREAAARQLPEAEYALGTLYGAGQGVERSDALAFEWYRKAASRGLPSAEHAVGYALSEGAGTQKDQAGAVDWFRKAALHGHAKSAFRLSALYADGDGVAKSPAESLRWKCRAALLGDRDAQRSLSAQGGLEAACDPLRDDLLRFAENVLEGDRATAS